jgi:poly(A) polymerase
MSEAPIDLSPDYINVNALKVINRLTSSGYQAYLVGGCVRDLLLGNHPKDFDVATNARPDEVHELFRNSRLIGRRFKIVHVRFGREIIEVATFRAPHSEQQTEQNFSDEGMILSDNIYGTFSEDSARRDFTVNALYYDPENDTIHDEVKGVEDLGKRQIRLIGDPDSRYREDPVRMLRAVRFKAKLNFEIEPATAEPLRRLGLLRDIPPARLFEEVLKLFMTGHGERSFAVLREYDLFGWLFPDTNRLLETAQGAELIRLALASTDRRIALDMPVTPAFIFAALLWQPYIEQRQRREQAGESAYVAGFEGANEAVTRQLSITSIPKRFSGPMRDIWSLQYRLPTRSGKKPETLLLHKRFRAAYDFLLLREESGESLGGLGEWWTRFQETAEDQRGEMLTLRGSDANSAETNSSESDDSEAEGSEPSNDTRAKRPRRRRRKPANQS